MITKKAFSRVNILRKFKFILDRKTLQTIYITFIRSLLEYADVVWDNIVLYNSDVIYEGNVKDLIEFFIIVMLYVRAMLKI
jgi:hypothetical protein